MKIIVCDTGPILHLREIDLLDLLEKAGKITIPKGVDLELSQIDLSWKDQKPIWISVKKLPLLEDSKVSILYNSGLLDLAEAEAIVLAQHLKADWFLTDDMSARIFGNTIGLEVHGTLGVVLWGAVFGHLKYEEAKVSIQRLSQSSLWISQSILEKALRSLDQIFE